MGSASIIVISEGLLVGLVVVILVLITIIMHCSAVRVSIILMSCHVSAVGGLFLVSSVFSGHSRVVLRRWFEGC